jgi:hypothetical protein
MRRQRKVIAGLAFVWLAAACSLGRMEGELEEAVPPTPFWIDQVNGLGCVPPTEAEAGQAQHALQSIELFERFSWPAIGASRYFSQPQIRGTGTDAREICPPANLYPRLSELLVRKRYFDGAYLFHDEVGLARATGARDPKIVDATGRTAFHEAPIIGDDPLKRDVRPLARTVLAEFGAASAAYRERAFAEMSADTAMGTSAAQLAVAAGHPGALERTKALMTDTLDRHKDPIPRNVRDRLFELAYALAFAGQQAVPFMDPVYAMLDRRVESWAPPFGMIDLEPATLCLVLLRVGGDRVRARVAEPPCNAVPLIFPN